MTSPSPDSTRAESPGDSRQIHPGNGLPGRLAFALFQLVGGGGDGSTITVVPPV